MVEVLVTGGAGFIGSNFVRWAHARASGLAHHDARQADLRRPAREPARRDRQPAASLRPGRHRRRGGRGAARPARRTIVVHFAAETHVDRSILAAGEFIQHRRLRHVRAARGRARGAARCAASSRSRPTRSTAACPTGTAAKPTSCGRAIRTRRARPAPIGSPTATGRPTACRSSSRARRTTTARISFPRRSFRSSSPTRSTSMPLPLYGDGLNVRDWLHVDDHCRGDRPADRAGRSRARSTTSAAATRCANVDLTHRILELAGRPASLIQPVADRPGHDRRYALDTTKLRGARLAARGRRSRTGSPRPSSWYRENEWWWRPIKEQDPAFRAYYDAQYGAGRAPDARHDASTTTLVTGATGFAGSICSIGSADRAPRRRLAPARRHGRRAADARIDVAGRRPARPRRRRPRDRRDLARADLPPRRRAARGHVVAERRCRTSRRTRSARITCSRRCGGAGDPCRVLVVSSAQIYQAERRSDRRRRAARARPTRTACRSSRRTSSRCARRRDERLDVVIARPFNHVGPRPGARRSRCSSFARQIARIEAGLAPPVIRVGNLDARRDITDVRDVVDAYVRLDGRRAARPAVQRLLRPRVADWRSARRAAAPLDGRDRRSRSTPRACGRTTCRSSRATAAAIRAELGWTPHDLASSRRCATRSTGGGARRDRETEDSVTSDRLYAGSSPDFRLPSADERRYGDPWRRAAPAVPRTSSAPTLRDVADAVREAGIEWLRTRASAPTRRATRKCTSAPRSRRSKGMPFKWALNPYRGCTHACEYCYARKYQRHLELGAGDDFSSLILVKRNLPEVLRRELARAGVGTRDRRGRHRDRSVSADRRSLPDHATLPRSARATPERRSRS